MTLNSIALLASGLALVATFGMAQGQHDMPIGEDVPAEDRADLGAATNLAPTGAMSTLDGAYTQEQADRGRMIHIEHCAGCHGANMRGAGTMGPSIIGSRFQRRWVGATVADLFGYLNVAMPKGEPGTLTDREYAQILAYILFRAGYPVGTTGEIPVDPSAQALISIVSQ